MMMWMSEVWQSKGIKEREGGLGQALTTAAGVRNEKTQRSIEKHHRCQKVVKCREEMVEYSMKEATIYTGPHPYSMALFPQQRWKDKSRQKF